MGSIIAPPDELLDRLRQIGMSRQDRPEHNKLRRASVLVPLFLRRNGDAEEVSINMLFTQRPIKMRTHPGEVCFPGGKQDHEDNEDDVVTALREAQEEVGLDRIHVQPICRLETLESYTGLCVTPVVGLIRPSHKAEPSNLTISQDEVEAAFSVPLLYFLEESNLSSKQEIPWRGGVFEVRTYHYESSENQRTFKISGLTAHIAHQVAQLSVVSAAVSIAVERPMSNNQHKMAEETTLLNY
jgi:coenzyme A diphosphatase NUDT7